MSEVLTRRSSDKTGESAMKHEITITIDEAQLSRVNDTTLAAWWHTAQADPADGFATPEPGELAEKIGREIIRRWLGCTAPELYHHQGHHYYWSQLRKLGKWNAAREFVPNARPAVSRAAAGDAEVPGE